MAKGKTVTKTTANRKRQPEPPMPVAEHPRPRRLRLPAYRPFRLKRIRYPEKLPSVWRLTANTAELFWHNRTLFIGIGVVYAVLVLILVRGFDTNIDVVNLKHQLDLGPSQAAQLVTGISVLTSLFTSTGTSAADTSGAYQLVVGLLVSLATIWAARQSLAGQRVRIRDAFYKGEYPFVPFVLVLIVALLQTIPLLVGTWLYTTAVSTGIAANGLEQLLWGALLVVLATISFYMLCSSLFALYIVTLPDMTPLKALRSARQLVRYRRGQVFRKLVYLPVALLVIISAIMLPFILFAAVVAPWLFFILTTFALIFVHLYMYTVYKALLA